MNFLNNSRDTKVLSSRRAKRRIVAFSAGLGASWPSTAEWLTCDKKSSSNFVSKVKRVRYADQAGSIGLMAVY